MNKINSFKLIIITRFFNYSHMNISCIVYNFIEDNYRFMTKGPPEKILKHYINNSIPEIDKILSKSLKEGFRVIACATKIIQYNQNDKNQKEEFYLKDLTFCGFILFKNKLKNESKQIIENITKMEIDLAISTGDEPYNTIESGIKCGLFSEKNIFIIDLNNKGKTPKIFVRCVNKTKREEEKESTKEDKTFIENLDESNKSDNTANLSSNDKPKFKNFIKKKSFSKIEKNNDIPSSRRQFSKISELNFNNKEINKNEEIESSSKDKIDTSHFDEGNSQFNYFNEDLTSASFNKIKPSLKYSGSELINDLGSCQKNNNVNLIGNENEKNRINIRHATKNLNIYPEKKSIRLNEFHLDSFMHYQNFHHRSIRKKRS